MVALTQTLLPLIKESPAGRIVNLSSILGSLTLHADKTSDIYKMKGFAYDASKAAFNAFTIHLAQALRDTKIKVNSAHPGWVKTDMGGAGACEWNSPTAERPACSWPRCPTMGQAGDFFTWARLYRGDRLTGRLEESMPPKRLSAPMSSRWQ